MAHAPNDELLSAMLDGEPAPGDTAHTAECDLCQARLGQLRRAATAMATPVSPPPGHLREAAVREALLVADDATRGPGRVLQFRRRSSSAPRQRRRNPLSAAAALLVALLVGGWALSMVGRDNGNRLDETTLASPGITAAADATLGLTKDSAASEAATSTARDAGDIGVFDDIALVAKQYELDSQRALSARDATTGSASVCPAPESSTLVWHAILTFRGTSAVAHVVEFETKKVMQILVAENCSLIASQDFAPTTPR